MERKLNEFGQLEPNTYPPPPNSMKWRNLHHEVKYGYPFLALGLILAVKVLIEQGLTMDSAVMLGLTAVVFGIGLWSIRHLVFKHFKPSYTVNGVKVTFASTKYYIPPEVMGEFVDEVFDAFKGVHDNPSELFEGVKLHILDKRPTDPQGIRKDLVGLTYTRLQRASYVYGPYALSHGGAGYELRLHGAAMLNPMRSEAEDIKWMQENDII